MSNVKLMKRTCSWIETEICSKVKLLVPDDDVNDEDYQVSFAHPAVYPYFVPTKEMQMDALEVPSVCVQFVETEESFKGAALGNKTINIRLVLTVWNPGDQVIYKPHAEVKKLGSVAYTEDTEGYTRNLDGWEDLVNLQDTILEKLKAEEFVEGMAVDMKSIKYGMFKDETDSIYVLYPYWSGYIDFTATMGATRLVPNKYENIL